MIFTSQGHDTQVQVTERKEIRLTTITFCSKVMNEPVDSVSSNSTLHLYFAHQLALSEK